MARVKGRTKERVQTSLFLRKDVWGAMKKMAEKENRTLSNMLECACLEYLASKNLCEK